jgi:hypothetical protein
MTRSLVGTPASKRSTKHGLWQLLKRGLTVGALGALGTFFVSLLQYQSAYQDKVATIAKEDTAAATTTLNDTLSTMSTAILLQQRLIADFYKALHEGDLKNEQAYPTTDARSIYKGYADAYTVFSENYALLVRKVELYLDWPTDSRRNSTATAVLISNPLNTQMLAQSDFDCERDMPSFESGKSTQVLKNKTTIDWNNAAHHVLTIEYCFEATHYFVAGALQWASKQPISDIQLAVLEHREDLYRELPRNQVLRLNSFMSLAMYKIELLRSRYQPYSLLCILPFARCS